MKFRTLGVMVALAACAAHAVDDTAFTRCRSIADTAARLACYDALPVAPAAPMQSAPSRPAAAAPAPSSAAPARAPASTAESFGMEEKIAATSLPPTMESHIPGHFEGWGPSSRIKLANGQVWQVVDGTSAFFNRDNPRVVVRRGLMGGFFLEIENSNRSPRVRRVQ